MTRWNYQRPRYLLIKSTIFLIYILLKEVINTPRFIDYHWTMNLAWFLASGYDHDHMLTWKMFFQRLKLLLLFWQKERVTDTDRCLTNDLPSLPWCRRLRIRLLLLLCLQFTRVQEYVLAHPKLLVHCAARRRRRRTRSIFASNKHKITIFL